MRKAFIRRRSLFFDQYIDFFQEARSSGIVVGDGDSYCTNLYLG